LSSRIPVFTAQRNVTSFEDGSYLFTNNTKQQSNFPVCIYSNLV